MLELKLEAIIQVQNLARDTKNMCFFDNFILIKTTSVLMFDKPGNLPLEVL